MESVSLTMQNLQPCHSSGQYLCSLLKAKYSSPFWLADDKVYNKNWYINTSVQNAEIPEFLGCLEHATMIWSANEETRKEKMDQHVVRLGPANAYGMVRHRLMQKAMNIFHVPEGVRDTMMRYYIQFHICFSTKDYVTSWQPLKARKPMGSAVSPPPFVMAIGMVVRGAENGWWNWRARWKYPSSSEGLYGWYHLFHSKLRCN